MPSLISLGLHRGRGGSSAVAAGVGAWRLHPPLRKLKSEEGNSSDYLAPSCRFYSYPAVKGSNVTSYYELLALYQTVSLLGAERQMAANCTYYCLRTIGISRDIMPAKTTYEIVKPPVCHTYREIRAASAYHSLTFYLNE